MRESTVHGPVAVGQPAPDFDLPLVEPEGRVTLESYRGTRPLLLALFRGLACPFCRRLVATTKQLAVALDGVGVDTLAVTASPLKAARLYARYRPAGLPLASDPWYGIHRAYGIPLVEISETEPSDWPSRINIGDAMNTPINPTGELPEPLPVPTAGDALDKLDKFEEIKTDEDKAPGGSLALSGYFLIDRGGIVRWRFVEAIDSLSDYGQYPNADEMLQAAQDLAA